MDNNNLDILIEDCEFRGSQQTFYAMDTHLQTAILPHKRTQLLEAMHSIITARQNQGNEGNKPRSTIEESAVNFVKLFDKKNPIIIESEYYYPVLLRDTPEIQNQTNLDIVFKRAHDVALPFVKTAIRLSIGTIDKVTANKLAIQYDGLKECEAEVTYYRVKSFFENIRNFMIRASKKRDANFHNLDIYRERFGFVNCSFLILNLDSKYIVFDYEQILMLYDVSYSRYLVYSRCNRAEQIESNYNLPTIRDLDTYYSWGDNLIKRYGNDAYSTIKEIEATCTAVLLCKLEKIPICRDFMERLTSSFDDDIKANLIPLINFLLEEKISTTIVVEFSGLFRHFGHPTINENKGCEKVKEIARRDLKIDGSKILTILGCMVRHFIINFIKKNHRWPPCTYKGHKNDMKKLVDSKATFFNENLFDIELDDWALIEFQKTFDFDYFMDYTTIISDKATSPPRSNYEHVYNPFLLEDKRRPQIFNSRRLIQEVLTRDNIDMKSLIDQYISGDIPLEWLVVGLHPKERELNKNGRLFSVNSLEMRLIFGALEKDIATHLFPYFSFQTMTWSEATLTKHMIELTNPFKQTDYLPIVFSVDFFKFCLMWRYESTQPFLEKFDELFGLSNCYSKVHKMFENSFYYLSSFNNPPDYLRKGMGKCAYPFEEQESTTTWIGQKGGNEGVLQKMWTVIIGSVLLTAAHTKGLKVELIGMEDNQIMVIYFPKLDNTPNIEYVRQHQVKIETDIKDFIKELEKYISSIGMILKIEETWISTRLFSYGKEVYIDGTQVPQTLKRVSRVFADTNDSFPSLTGYIASISAAGHSIALKGLDAIDPYYVSMKEIAGVLMREPFMGSLIAPRLRVLIKRSFGTLTVEDMVNIISIPKDFGGLPITNYLDYIYRGHPDPLTSQMTWLNALELEIPFVTNIKEWIISGHSVSNNLDYKLLIQDPVAINWKRPMVATNRIKRDMEARLSEICKNKMFKQLFAMSEVNKFNEMTDYLMEIKPCFPRVLNDILRLSPEGARLGFLAMFSNVRTLKACLTAQSVTMIAESFQDQDVEWYMHLLTLVRKTIGQREYMVTWCQFQPGVCIKDQTQKNWSCISELAQCVRNVTWRVEVKGSTTPHPSEQFGFSIVPISNSGECKDCTIGNSEYILYKMVDYSELYQSDHIERNMRRGRLMPYCGSGTGEKRGTPLLPFPQTDRSITACKQLFRMLKWVCVNDGTLPEFIDALIKSRSEIPNKVLQYISGDHYGGSMTHRYNDVILKHAARPNTRITINTQIFMSSDKLGIYARGKENYTIHYQGVFLYGHHFYSTYYTYLNKASHGKAIMAHSHPKCKSCFQLCDDTNLYTNAPSPRIKIYPDCYIIYTKLSDVSMKFSLSFMKGVIMVNYQDSPKRKHHTISAAASVLLGLVALRTSQNLKIIGQQSEPFQGSLPLTIGILIKLTAISVIKRLSHLWMIYIADELLVSLLDGTHGDILTTLNWLVTKFNIGKWANLISIMCTPEIRSELIANNMYPESSEAFHTGSSIESLVKRIFYQELKHLFPSDESKGSLKSYAKKFTRQVSSSIHFVTAGLTYNTCAKLWLNSSITWSLIVQMTGDDLTKEKKKKIRSLYYKTNQLFVNSFSGDNFSYYTFITGLRSLYDDEDKYNKWLNTYAFRLSELSADAWIKEYMGDPSEVDSLTVKIKSGTKVGELDTHLSQLRHYMHHEYIWYIDEDIQMDPHEAVSDIVMAPNFTTPMEETSANVFKKEDHLYRLNGFYSTAFLKYHAILIKMSIVRIRKALTLAEGSGSVARLLFKAYNCNELYYNSLYDITKSLSHRGVDYVPAELLDIDPHHIFGLKDIIASGGDITKPNVQDDIISYISKNVNEIDLITCDAETSGEFNNNISMKITWSLINLMNHLKKGTLLIFKTFMNDRDRLMAQICCLLGISSTVKILVPPHSSNNSYECFLCCYKELQSNLVDSIDILSNPLLYNQMLSQDQMSTISSLCDIRKSGKPFLSSATNYHELCLLYKQIGFPINIEKAWLYYINNLSSDTISLNLLRNTRWISNDLRCFIEDQLLYRFSLLNDEHIIFNDVSKLQTSKIKKTRGKNLSTLGKYTNVHHRKESLELKLISDALMNIDILVKTLNSQLSHREVLLEYPFYLEFWYNDSFLYESCTTLEDWLKNYGRFYFKIIGFNKICLF